MSTAINSQAPGGVMANIELWLKANQGVEKEVSNATEDGDLVLNWLDNSINSNHATQTIGANRPVYHKAAINFNPIIDFDGTNHELMASTTPNDSITIFVVGKGTYTSTTKNIINHNNGSNGWVAIEQTTATTLQGLYNNGTVASGIVTTSIANSKPFLIEYVHSSGGNSELFEDGLSQGTASASTNNLSGNLTTYIGGHPSNTNKRWNGGVAELIIYNQLLTAVERNKVASYFAIKYGFTLGANGTSLDYVDSDGTVIWDQSVNAGYNYNVTGIGRDDISKLEQKQSRTINTTNDITVGIKDIATANKDNGTEFFADKTFLMWGHNNGATTATTDITKDFSDGIVGVTTKTNVTPIARKWKMLVNDSIPTVKLSIPESMVSATNPGGKEYVMIIADDAAFTTNVTSATMKDVGTNLVVDFYFEGTKYITFGATAISEEVSRAVSFNRNDMYLDAGDVNDLANTDYTISAWVKRSDNTGNFDVISKRNYFNENTNLDPGPDNDGNYTHGYTLRIDKDNKFRMEWRDPEDPSSNIMQTSATIPENEWHHVAVTYNSGTNITSLYVDGYLEDQDETLDPMNTPSDAHFMIGAAHHIKRQQKHSGSIDEVRVWDIALTVDQIRYIMNQEIEKDGTFTDGKVLPSVTTRNEIMSIPWNNLIAYYPMNRMVFGSMKDESNYGNDASMINYDQVDVQTAPLPYQTTQNGDWDDPNTWVNGNVQYLPGVNTYFNALETIDYNIVEINHNVTLDNSDITLIPADKNGNRTVLGLVINSGELEVQGNNESNTGYGLTVSHYLKIDGKIDLEGESQLIQGENSDLDVTSAGTIEKDQQGTADYYTYNYWSAPVGISNTTTNNNSYTLPNVVKDGTTASSPQSISWLTSGYNGTSGSPIGIADYWVWKYVNQINNNYPSWQHVRSTGSLQPGEGFTMKGSTDTGGVISTLQNYVFDGKPHNGDIMLTLSAGNDYLVGNPYASAIDANEFIMDNISVANGGRATNNIIDGTLYYWDHFANASHVNADYQGGYATYNLLGSIRAISNDLRINKTGQTETKTPGQYIPVAQGFFVTAYDGGDVTFKNSQRFFKTESSDTSQFIRTGRKFKKSNNNTRQVSEDAREKIWLMFNSPNGYHRQLLVGVDQNASQGRDIAYDAPLIENNNEDLYWNIANDKYVIQGIDNFNNDQVLPLGVKVELEGTATFKIDQLMNIPEGKIIYLHDKDLDIYHDLKTSNYETFLTAGEHNQRFEITFGSMSLSDDVKEEISNFDVHYANSIKSIVISNPTGRLINKIEMINILGQSVYKNNLSSLETHTELKIKNLNTGTYIINLTSENRILTKKVIVE